MSAGGGFWKPKAVSHRRVLLQEDDEGVGGVPLHVQTAPLAQQRLLLPIHKHRRQILYAVEEYPVVVVVGETGSGKSTQIPRYLYENGWCENGFQVVCTQPRRIAAQSLAERVSQELGTDLGQTVGYTVRFDNVSSVSHTRIKYVTDGMLLREATLADPLLSRYSVIMIDEAHERNLHSDALLGIVKKIRRKRPNLRVIVCSATIDAQAFVQFFVPNNHNPTTTRKRKSRWGKKVGQEEEDDSVPPAVQERGTILSVDGRQHPVDILYLDKVVSDYIRCTVETVMRIHETEGGGDVLAFLPSGEDIDKAIRMAQDYQDNQQQQQQQGAKKRKNAKQLAFLPLYGSLPYQMQARVFQPKKNSGKERNTRRVIFATNMAETSVTVPDITHVIDCGYAKLPFFDPQTGFDRLIVAPISQASARQRSGRAGRVQPGKCYRLYQESYFCNKMPEATPPEVLRTNLTGFLLTLKALGVHNILSFDLMDLPSVEALSHGLECLYALGALDDQTTLTARGTDMAAFPTEPRVSRMLLESLERKCSWEVLAVASALQVSRSLLVSPRTPRQRLDYDAVVTNESWIDRTGDHVTYANLLAEAADDDYYGWNAEDCQEKFVNYVALRRALEIRTQLTRSLRRYGRVQAMGLVTDQTDARGRAIRQCVTAGFFFNVAKLANDGRYYTLRGQHMVTPASGSILHSHGDVSEYIVFGETHDGSRGGIEIRSCSTIEARWLREIAPHYWE